MPDGMKSFAIYGKGGSGKSTVASNLSVQFARKQLKTLQIGCDPKHDSTRSLTGGGEIVTVIDILKKGRNQGEAQLGKEAYLTVGKEGIGCIEAGGPESGTGCAGLGIVSAFKLFNKHQVLSDYDVVVMDVLGDVVCGGFAMPLTKGLAGCVAIVVSEAPMSMYAANNIAKAVVRYHRNGIFLAGLIANGIRNQEQVEEIEDFAGRLNTRVLVSIPHDPRILAAERRAVPVSLLDAGGEIDGIFSQLCDQMLSVESSSREMPTPLTGEQWEAFMRHLDERHPIPES
jgi:nitrogenase iron protein NifH